MCISIDGGSVRRVRRFLLWLRVCAKCLQLTLLFAELLSGCDMRVTMRTGSRQAQQQRDAQGAEARSQVWFPQTSFGSQVESRVACKGCAAARKVTKLKVCTVKFRATKCTLNTGFAYLLLRQSVLQAVQQAKLHELLLFRLSNRPNCMNTGPWATRLSFTSLSFPSHLCLLC